MNKNKFSRFLLSASAGMFSTVGVSEISAISADQLAVFNAAVNDQIQTISADRVSAIQHFQEVEGATAPEAARMADVLTSDANTFGALRRLGSAQSKTLFSHFHKVLKGGVELTPEHFNDFLSDIADQDTLQALGVADVRELKSPSVERLVAPEQVTTLDEALYFANQRKVSGEYKAAAEFYVKARSFATDSAQMLDHAENALLMYSEHFVHNVARVNVLTAETVSEARALFEGSVKTLASTANSVVAYQRAAMCAKELGTATYDLIVLKEAELAVATEAAVIVAKRQETAKLLKELYQADMLANAMYVNAMNQSEGSDKNAFAVQAADQEGYAIGALAAAESQSRAIVAAGGTALMFDGEVTIAAKMLEAATAFEGKYIDLVDASPTDQAAMLLVSADRATIEGSKLKAVWNARRQYDVGSASYTTLVAQYDALKMSIDAALATANIQYNNLQSDNKYMGAVSISAVRRVHTEVLYRDAVTAVETDALTAEITDLVAYVNGDQAAIVSELDTALASAVNAERALNIREARNMSRKIMSAAQGRVALSYAKEVAARAGKVVADDTANMTEFLAYAQKSNTRSAWEAGVVAADAMLADATISAAAADPAMVANVLARSAKAEGLLRRNTDANDALVASVDAAGALSAGILFDAQTVAAAIAPNSAEAEAAYAALTQAFEQGAELHNTVAVKQGIRTEWAAVEDAYAAAVTDLADTANSANVQLGDAGFITELYTQVAAGAANADVAEVITDLDTWAGAAGAAGVAEAGTLGEYYNTVANVDASLDTIEKLYNNLMTKYAELRTARTDVYGRYDTAAKAWDKARKAKSDYAVEAVAGLAAVTTSANWTASRDAAAAAHTAAAGFEASRLGALLASKGADTFADVNGLGSVLGVVTGAVATEYTTADVMDSLFRLGVSNKAAAKTALLSRDVVGTEVAVAADTVTADTAVQSAIEDSAGAGDGEGAYELTINLFNEALQGLAGFNDAADMGALAIERFTAVSDSFRHINTKWMSELMPTIAMVDTAAAQDTMKDVVHGLIQNNGAAVAATADLSGSLYSFDQLMDDSVGAANLVATQAYHRSAGLSYESMLRTVSTLGVAAAGATVTTDAALDVNKGHLWTVLNDHATRADAVARTDFVATADALTAANITELTALLTERANLAASAASGAYGGTLSLNASETADTYKVDRGLNVDAMIQLVLPQAAVDMAALIMNSSDTVVVTADVRAAIQHQLGRVYTNFGKALAMRYVNKQSTQHRTETKEAYLNAVTAYKTEVDAILSVSVGEMPDHNARLIAAYDNLSEAYKYAVNHGADAKLRRDQHLASFHKAQYMYRSGDVDGSFALLDTLVKNDESKSLIGGQLLSEIAEQYEGEGFFVKASGVYKEAAEVHASKDEVTEAYKAAENAMSDALQTGEPAAAKNAAMAFEAIGNHSAFHGRVRAEAFHNAAEAYIFGKMWKESAADYVKSAELWVNIGDHMQAGNQYEKAAWALTKMSTLAIADRVMIMDHVASASYQLQTAGAIKRVENIAKLSETQFSSVNVGTTSTADLKKAVVLLASALVEKVMAFQREGDVSHAIAAETRVRAVLTEVNAASDEAVIHVKLADLLMLQKKYADATDSYIKAAENYKTGSMSLKATEAYKMAADAALEGTQGSRVRDSILPAILKLSDDLAGSADALSVHMDVLSVYVDMVALLPAEIDAALTKMAAVEAEVASSTNNLMKSTFAAMKVSLLDRKARQEPSDAKMTRLASAKNALDAVKDLVGATDKENTSVQSMIAKAAAELSGMYHRVKAFDGENGLTKISELKSVLSAASEAATSAYASAEKAKVGFDSALSATKYAATAQLKMARAMMHYMHTQTDKSRIEDIAYFKSLPQELVNLSEVAIKSLLRGLLKTREAAAVMQDEFVEVMNAANKVNRWVVHFRKDPVSRDQHGDSSKAAVHKAKIAETAANLVASTSELDADAKIAHAEQNPVERAKKTDALVAAQADKTAATMTLSLQASSDLAVVAPVGMISEEDLSASSEVVKHITGKDGFSKRLRGVAAGPSSRSTKAVANPRMHGR